MISDAGDAFAEIFSPPFRRVMGKSLALTATILILAGSGWTAWRSHSCMSDPLGSA